MLLGLTIVTILFTTEGFAQTWAERLGYPAGQKVVILDAREMGLCWEMNSAGQKLLEQQAVQSITAIPTGPWFDGFAAYCRKHQLSNVGISIALTNPYRPLHWRFASSRNEVPSLVNQDGFPWRSPFKFAANAKPDDVRKEIHAQIQRARMAGLNISHISGYHGAVYSRTDTAKVFLEASRKYWIPCPVVELEPEDLERFRQQGYPLSDDLIELVHTYPLPKLDELEIAPDGKTYDEKRDLFCDLLRRMQPGLTLIMLRPALETEGIKELSHDWQQRVWDGQLLVDEKVKAVFAEQQIVFTDWREIMHRFEGVPGKVDVSGTTDDDIPVDVPIP